MSRVYADVIVDISQEKLDKTFQYEVPEALQKQAEIGKQVRISFGNGKRELTGYIVGLSGEAKIAPERIKPILKVEEKGMEIESRLISLAAWIAREYGSTMNQALKTVLPVKAKERTKEKRYLCLREKEETCAELLEEYKRKHYKAKERLLQALLENETLEYSDVTGRLKITASVIRSFREQGLVQVIRERDYRNPVAKRGEVQEVSPLKLTPLQEQVCEEIFQEWETPNPRPCLIKGVTGSGKTEVYMKLISHVLEQGQQVIVLIPEIALTYQNVSRFYRRFGNCVALINSRLSKGERFDQLEQAKKGEVSIVIGPRSALFTPFPNLGLILIDEEHEDSYKSEKTPCYHARETAICRGEMEGARVVLGSASPSVESYYKGKTGEYRLLYLEERYGASQLPEVSVVDLKEELKTGNRSVFSSLLTEKIRERLMKKEQVMLFLNRRG